MIDRRGLLLVPLLALPLQSVRASGDGWAALRQGQAVALIRHATAPGTGDPTGFRLGDCSTQRNLSAEGRRQAMLIGDVFRQNGIVEARVLSSQWCRCLDTARLMGLGPVIEQPLLNSFFGRPGEADPAIDGLRAWLPAQTGGAPLVLVTHQVNITGLTGIVPASGEIILATIGPNGTVEPIERVKT